MLPTVDHPARLRQDPYDLRSRRAARLVSHRVCAPEDAPFVELSCRAHPSVLPRWQQADRGPQNTTRGHHSHAPDGAYAGVSVWVDREHWLTWVMPVALAVEADTLRGHVSQKMMRRYLTVRTGYALSGTGRRAIVRPDTIASVLGVDTRTVQRCQQYARLIGLEVVIETGRMLTLEECLGARRRGSRQRGLSTEVAFTRPASIPRHLWTATPTSGTHSSREQNLEITHFKRKAAARGQIKDAASPRPPQPKRANPAIARRLALEVARALPWCSQESPRRIAPALTRFATCSPAWEACDVVSALTDAATRQGKQSPTIDRTVTRPWALLAAMLRGVDEHNDYPGAAFPIRTVEAPSCELVGCDGWITVEQAGPDTNGAVRTCPDPAHRRVHHLDVEAHESGDDQCPF